MTGLFAEAPALPLHTAGPYVAAAYVFFLAIVVIYVAIMATKLMRMNRGMDELTHQLDARDARHAAENPSDVPTPDAADEVAARTIVKES